jgi:Na+-translocating ferredoxin:NAD+ oxidoreductase RnfD subunit
MSEKKKDMRLAALRRFATAITILNILGHSFLGFEQSLAQPVVALLTAYSTEILLEMLMAWRQGKRPRFLGPGTTFIDFLLSAHISGLAVSMLLYANDALLPVAFAAAAAIGSKYVFRAGVNGSSRHFFNPSNVGITATLVTFPWVGIAQPYMFTENLGQVGDWVLPAIIICSGSFLNTVFTKRVPLILSWAGAFVLQAALRHFLLDQSFLAALNPMTGVAFLLFTFYMVTDPATTPTSVRGQIAFGVSVALTYGLLVAMHVVFGLFFALTLVCIGRGVLMYARALADHKAAARVQMPMPAVAGQ